jgi:hypothetical protein
MSVSAAKAAFETLRGDFLSGNFPLIAGRMAGRALDWGADLLDHFRSTERAELMALDGLSRFWVVRYRGMAEPADLTGATPGAGFVLAFTAFPYLDVMMEVWSLGAVVEESDSQVTFGVLFDGEDQGSRVTAYKAGAGWQFDLMDLYGDKARAFDAFLDAQYDGDFDAFLDAYVAEHDLDFNVARAWKKLDEGAQTHGR